MKGSETKLLEYMEGAKKRFVIPVYQRNYDWKIDNCRQLFDDLVKVVKNKRHSHFFGSIVSSYQPNGRYTEYLVIDGQQRLTTVSLLLLAMYNLIIEKKVQPQTSTMASEILEDYLVDKHQPKETRIKLKPVKDDRAAFEKLFSDSDENDRQSNLTINYEYFYNRIQKEEISIEELYDALFTLEIINIELTADDDPQLIFESLNSTGMALSEGDKIRNFMLMGLPTQVQDEYYEKYWNRIEICTGYDVSSFVRDYLSVKQQTIPTINKVYTAFKAYVEATGISAEPLLQDLLAYAKRYAILLRGKTEDRSLNACIYRLNRLETTITRPFFLEVLRMKEEGSITISETRDIFLLTESYLFRRNICDLPTNALNKIFLMLHREIIRYDGSSSQYFEKFKFALLSKSDRARFPLDEEFIDAFAKRPVYQMNMKNKLYILERLENHDTLETKEIYAHCDDGTYSIEHIMPQHLTPAWISELGEGYEEIHETWLHRLANLTLTAYNSKYSNNSFRDKVQMEKGFAQSGLRMNFWVAQQKQWGLAELEERSEMLMQQALAIWALPETTYRPAEKQLDFYTLGDDVDLSGRDIIRFAFMKSEQPVDSWVLMMESVLKMLHEQDPSVLTHIAHIDDPDNDLSPYVRSNPAALRGTIQIDTDVFVERNTSTNTKIAILKRIFKAFNADPEDLVFYMKDADADDKADEQGTRYEIRRKYWKYALEFIHEANAADGCFANVHDTKMNWISGYIGIGGFKISCVANWDVARVEISLEHFSKERNKSAFDYLFARKEQIEEMLGTEVLWWRLDDKKGSYVSLRLTGVSINNETDWTQMAKFHAEWSRKFYDVFVPLLKEWSLAQ